MSEMVAAQEVAQKRILERLRRRRGLIPAAKLVAPAKPVVTRGFVGRKFDELEDACRAMERFLEGSGLLPGNLKDLATIIEGNFYPNTKELRKLFRDELDRQ